jgi:hypothetical protein
MAEEMGMAGAVASALNPKTGECVYDTEGTIPKTAPILVRFASIACSRGLPFGMDGV